MDRRGYRDPTSSRRFDFLMTFWERTCPEVAAFRFCLQPTEELTFVELISAGIAGEIQLPIGIVRHFIAVEVGSFETHSGRKWCSSVRVAPG